MSKPIPCGHGRNFCLECHDTTAHVSISTMKEREKWILSIERAIKCGLPKLLVADLKKVISGLERSIKYGGTQRLRGRIEELEAQQPASVAVPEGWMLVERSIWTESQVDAATKSVAIVQGIPGATARDIAMAAMDAAQCKAPDVSLDDLLAAAPHPVSGEQKPTVAHALKLSGTVKSVSMAPGQWDDLKRHGCEVVELVERGAPPAAQDVRGLVEALERIKFLEVASAGSVSEWSSLRHKVSQIACEALAAHRAQTQGGHDSDCSTNNRGVPELLGPCDCSLSGEQS